MMNTYIESYQRATVISIGNVARKLGVAIVAPIFGYVVILYNINNAYRISTLASLISFFFLLKLKEEKKLKI